MKTQKIVSASLVVIFTVAVAGAGVNRLNAQFSSNETQKIAQTANSGNKALCQQDALNKLDSIEGILDQVESNENSLFTGLRLGISEAPSGKSTLQELQKQLNGLNQSQQSIAFLDAHLNMIASMQPLEQQSYDLIFGPMTNMENSEKDIYTKLVRYLPLHAQMLVPPGGSLPKSTQDDLKKEAATQMLLSDAEAKIKEVKAEVASCLKTP